jgi:hypothetical protein
MRLLELFIDMFELIDHFRPEVVDARVDTGNIIGDRLETAFDLFAELVERRLLHSHMQQVYHAASN